MTLTKRFRGNDGAIYYVREIGDQVFWFGEHGEPSSALGSERDTLSFANVFVGRRQGDDIRGEWFDVPKGHMRGSGILRVRVSQNDARLERIEGTGGFGGRVWRADGISQTPRVASVFHNPGFQGNSPDDLSGTWMGDDGGVYYVRKQGNRVVWFGERGNTWSNVFVGSLEGDQLRGQWADVPKGGTSGAGSLTLQLTNHYTLERSAVSGGFGGSRWDRVHCKGLTVRLDRLTILDKEDEFDGDEPYLWTMFFKVDGDRMASYRLREASATVISNSGSHRNLTPHAQVPERTTLSIPAHVGQFGTIVKTIRGLDPLSSVGRNATQFGMLVIAWDEDGLSAGAVEAGRRAFVNTLQQELDRAVRRLSAPDEEALEAKLREAAEAAIRAHGVDPFHLLFNDGPDDMVGRYTNRLTFTELMNLRTRPLNLHFREGAHYQVQGALQGT